MKIEKKNLTEKFQLMNDFWNPKIAGELNDSYLKLAKVKGEFEWHHHDNEDELFLVIKGKLLMKLHQKEIEINEGEFIIIPKGVEHKPCAKDEVQLLLLEPKTTLNTVNIKNERTIEKLEWI